MKERLRRLLHYPSRLSGQFSLGIGAAVALTVAASLVAWFFFDRVAGLQRRVNEGSVPEMVAAFGVARYASSLVAAAPRLTTAPTPAEFTAASARITDTHDALAEELDALQQAGTDADAATIERVRAHSATLLANIKAIEAGMTELFPLHERSAGLRSELAALRSRMEELVIPAIDDQLFYTITGYHTLGAPPAARAEHLSERELGRYRRLADLQADGNIAAQLLASAFNLQDASSIEPLRERFESAAGRIERSLAALEASPLRSEVVPIFARLLALGFDGESGFDLRTRELRLGERQRDLLARNRDLAVELVAAVDELVDTAHVQTRAATQASTQAILTARTLLLVISGVSLVGAVLIAWLFIGRVLLHRLGMLSDWMRRMAGGDLEARVEIGGRDEVADMAAALEVFRRHALEVQRLNLVERLAEELKGKNEQLETALEDLGRAQDQIVMREKLAALGELTAGVAHEIRNPLNFVKNFSEASEELLDELKEVLAEGGDKLDEEQRSLLAEITGDLVDNLGRIRSHGDRANRIVHDMLM
ncbi:MAG: HAMP domain-containing protein, partial [Spirochaetaceae bacterium]|nr:HAMP domain-containing protein [Spirochaetaceae bacterium]